MSSQEDYLDQLLRNIMNGGTDQPQAEADTEETSAAGITEEALEAVDMPEMSEAAEMSEIPEISDMNEMAGDVAVVPEMYDMPGLSDLDSMSGIIGEAGTAEETAAMPEDPGMDGMSGMPEFLDNEVPVPGLSQMPEWDDAQNSGMPDALGDFENDMEILGTPVEDTNIEALLKSLEDMDAAEEDKEQDSSESTDVSSMSEEEIDRFLAERNKMPESSTGNPEEAFQGDVVDLLKAADDSELQEIQGLLEKSDRNEAVGGEIEDLLREAAQDGEQNTSEAVSLGTVSDDTDGAGGQLSPKQQKAMEKKRLREEKAAARKAAKEARKAEKAARKAARGTGKSAGGAGAENEMNVPTGKSAVETEEAVDTALLDSILSEAGKINNAEALSGGTGNYEAKVEDVISEESEEIPAEEKAAVQIPSANDNLGIDLNNLFGSSGDAESAMLADGNPDLEGFVALDGDDMAGIIELGGEDEEETKPKKKGFFSRFLEFLTEEEEEEEENENIKLSEENQEIIEDLDKEKDQKNKKGKKGKKKVSASAEDGEDGEEGTGKAGKKKKAKKPKKEKPPKEEEPVDPGKRLSLKKVLPVVLSCLSLGVAIVILVFAFVDFIGNKAARDAYYDGDYKTCYQYLYGKDLNETEQIMYGRSQSILTIRLWIREYEILTAEGAKLEALDSLIQSVNNYPVLYEYAGKWNAAGEVAQEYATILNLLYENYGLTEDQARAIAAETNDIEYTRQVNAIAQGGAYGSWNEPEPEVDVPLQDELPEETELPEGNFIDTNTAGR